MSTRKVISHDEQNHGTSKRDEQKREVERRVTAEAALKAGFPRLYRELSAEFTALNYLRITMGRNGNYYAALGVWDTADCPLNIMGSGFTALDALYSLELALIKGNWRDDSYALEQARKSQ